MLSKKRKRQITLSAFEKCLTRYKLAPFSFLIPHAYRYINYHPIYGFFSVYQNVFASLKRQYIED